MTSIGIDIQEGQVVDNDPDRRAFLEAVAARDYDQIRSATRRILENTSSPSRTARFVRQTMQDVNCPDLKPFKIALLSSFSIEMVQDPLIAHGYAEGLSVNLYNPGYDQYHSEILRPDSGLYKEEPDLIILAVDGPRWAPELYGDYLTKGRSDGPDLVSEIVARVDELIGQIRQRTTSPVLLHSCAYPRHPALGILDASQNDGQRQLIGAVNSALIELSNQLGGVHLVDMDSVIQSIGHDHWYDPRLDFFARSPIARSAFDQLAQHYQRYLRALSGNSRKCVILDLDNTLWGGIVGEDGPLGVALGSEYPGNAFVAFQRAIINLRDRGVVLAIASKNNPGDVQEVFEKNTSMLLTLDDFAAKEIHWEPKSISVARIAEALNLGMRHMVFVDDNPAECLEVERAHPAATVISLPKKPEHYIEALLANGYFDTLEFSDEDSRRGHLYQQRDAAEKLRVESGSLEDYYRNLEMSVFLAPVTADSLSRASQMTKKTTQFNTTTRQYSELQLDKILSNPDWKTLTIRVVDRFGDNGIVGLLLAHRQSNIYEIDTCLLSCRVINRGVETTMLNWLAETARAEGLTGIEGWIYPTSRNPPVRKLYEQHGFSIVEESDENTKWRFELAGNEIEVADWLQINDTAQE